MKKGLRTGVRERKGSDRTLNEGEGSRQDKTTQDKTRQDKKKERQRKIKCSRDGGWHIISARNQRGLEVSIDCLYARVGKG